MKIKNWNKIVHKTDILISAIEVMNIIHKLKDDSEVLMVGGVVRDLVMNNEAMSDVLSMMGDVFSHLFNDIDIATSVPIDLIEPHFKCHDIGKNKDFGILVVEHNGFHFEVANYRSDGIYSDGRRPDSVKIIDSFKQDAARRDFTINAMGLDATGDVIDFFGGVEDIKNKVFPFGFYFI